VYACTPHIHMPSLSQSRALVPSKRPRRRVIRPAAPPDRDDLVPGRGAFQSRDELMSQFSREQAESLASVFPPGSTLAKFFAQMEEQRKKEEEQREQQRKKEEEQRKEEEEQRERQRKNEEEQREQQRKSRELVFALILLSVILANSPPGSPLVVFLQFLLTKLVK